MQDRIYTQQSTDPSSFVFDRNVAEVFPDMISRSVPGYAATLRMIGSIAERYATAGSHCYDLGCSLGAASLAVWERIGDRVDIEAIDASPAMIEGLETELVRRNITGIRTRVADIREVSIQNAGLCLLNFTLQFVPMEDRLPLLTTIASGTRPGGVLVLSEKIRFEDPDIQTEMTALHEAFKKANGYSELEISRKRAALEKVLIPETPETHQKRLRNAGFSRCLIWLRCFHFVSILAFRE